MAAHLALGDQSFAQQQLDVAVVARAGFDAAAAQLVDPAVADVRPIRAAVLDQAYGAGRARLVVERDAFAELDDTVVRARERQGQKALRIEHRQRHLGERFLERRDRHLGGARAVGVAAHAVDDHHQQRFAVGYEIDAILVFGPIARQSQLCIINAHALVPSPSRQSTSCRRRAGAPHCGLLRSRAGNSLMYTRVPQR